MSRFVDVNYRIVPFTRQTRSFFSPWPLIPSLVSLPRPPSSPLCLFLSIHPFATSIYLPARSTSLESTGVHRERYVEENEGQLSDVETCAETKFVKTTVEFRDSRFSKAHTEMLARPFLFL